MSAQHDRADERDTDEHEPVAADDEIAEERHVLRRQQRPRLRDVEAPPQHHERLEDAEQAERRDEPRQARRVAQQRHHDVGEQTEPDADEQAERDGQRRRHAAVAHVVADVGGDAAERARTEVQDARRAVHEHDAERDERGERPGRGTEQHETQRRLAEQAPLRA